MRSIQSTYKSRIMKKLLSILCLLVACNVNAQTTFCLAPSCPQTVTTKDTAKIFAQLSTSDGVKGIIFTVVSQPVNSPVLNMNILAPVWLTSLEQSQTVGVSNLAAGTYVFRATGTSVNGTVGTALDSLTVIPSISCPPIPTPRTVVGFTLTLVNGVWTPTYKFNDGSSQ